MSTQPSALSVTDQSTSAAVLKPETLAITRRDTNSDAGATTRKRSQKHKAPPKKKAAQQKRSTMGRRAMNGRAKEVKTTVSKMSSKNALPSPVINFPPQLVPSEIVPAVT